VLSRIARTRKDSSVAVQVLVIEEERDVGEVFAFG